MKRSAGLLSGGEQQMLSPGPRPRAGAIGAPRRRAVPRVGAPQVVSRLLASVRRAATDQGVAVLLVEQHVRQALAYADRVYVMERGRIGLSGTVDEVRPQLAAIESAYLSRQTVDDTSRGA